MSRRVAEHTYSPFGKRALLNPEALVGDDGLRLDGRGPEECRPAFLKPGTVSQAAGSAYFEFGDTKVLVAVYGPRESRKAEAFSDLGRLNCHVEMAPFATSVRGKNNGGFEEREYSGMLLRALEGAVALHSFPKTSVDVFALILQSGGSDLAAVITCGSAALADAGIEMVDLVTATSAVRVGRHVLLDPAAEEERRNDGAVLVAFMASRNEVTQLTLTGGWSPTKSREAIELCVNGCAKLDELVRGCLKEQAAGLGEEGGG